MSACCTAVLTRQHWIQCLTLLAVNDRALTWQPLKFDICHRESVALRNHTCSSVHSGRCSATTTIRSSFSTCTENTTILHHKASIPCSPGTLGVLHLFTLTHTISLHTTNLHSHITVTTKDELTAQILVRRRNRFSQRSRSVRGSSSPLGALGRQGLNPIKLAYNPSRPDGRFH